MSDAKRELVARAMAAADKVRPVLEARAAVFAPLATATDAALAATRAYLTTGDGAAAERAAAALVPLVERAWLEWDESAAVTRDLVARKRAVHAAEAALLAARAAAWAPDVRHSDERDPAEARARAAAGPVYETTEAERCAALATGAAG